MIVCLGAACCLTFVWVVNVTFGFRFWFGLWFCVFVVLFGGGFLVCLRLSTFVGFEFPDFGFCV